MSERYMRMAGNLARMNVTATNPPRPAIIIAVDTP
jgi:hypothetical protein